MSVIAELEQLQQKRQQHLDAVTKIDDELERVRIALGVKSPKEPAHYTARFRSSNAKLGSAIIQTINESIAPLSGVDVAERIHRSVGGTKAVLASLVQQGRIFAKRDNSRVGRPMFYARTADALAQIGSESSEGDDELGQSSPDLDRDTAPIQTVTDATASSQTDSIVTRNLVSSAPLNVNGGTC